MLIRTLKEFLNAATISRRQNIPITKIILSFGQIMLVPRCAATVSTRFVALHLVCFWHKADMTITLSDVRFGGKADGTQDLQEGASGGHCILMTRPNRHL